MATLKSDVYAIQNADSPPTKGTPGSIGGRIRSLYFEVAGAAVIATSDFVKLCKIPAGARIVDWKIFVPDVGSTGTAKIGYAASAKLDSAGVAIEAADDDAFSAAVAYTTTGGAITVPLVADVGLFKKFNAEVDVQMVFTVATDVGAVTIKGHFEYVID
jgi:hypothetical protein